MERLIRSTTCGRKYRRRKEKRGEMLWKYFFPLTDWGMNHFPLCTSSIQQTLKWVDCMLIKEDWIPCFFFFFVFFLYFRDEVVLITEKGNCFLCYQRLFKKWASILKAYWILLNSHLTTVINNLISLPAVLGKTCLWKYTCIWFY